MVTTGLHMGMTAGRNIYAYVGGNPVNYADPLGLFTIFGSLGGSAVGVYGAEGSGGIYINTTDADAGVFASGGTGWGLNISAGWQVGYMSGDVNAFRGETDNTNLIVLNVISVTIAYQGGEWQGISVGISPNPIPVAASATKSNTVAAGFRDLGKWMEKMRGGQSTFFPGMGKAKYPPRQPRRSNQTVCP